MPHYLPPEFTPDCQCKESPQRQMFCPTGHLTECHNPLDCATAACGHLQQYDWTLDEIRVAQHQMDLIFRERANADCRECNGAGFRVHQLQIDGETVVMRGPCECLLSWESYLERVKEGGTILSAYRYIRVDSETGVETAITEDQLRLVLESYFRDLDDILLELQQGKPVWTDSASYRAEQVSPPEADQETEGKEQ